MTFFWRFMNVRFKRRQSRRDAYNVGAVRLSMTENYCFFFFNCCLDKRMALFNLWLGFVCFPGAMLLCLFFLCFWPFLAALVRFLLFFSKCNLNNSVKKKKKIQIVPYPGAKNY